MQISHVSVTPIELGLRAPFSTAHHPQIDHVTVVFVHAKTRQGHDAWGCTAVDPTATDETVSEVVEACRACGDRLRDLSPLNTEFALDELSRVAVNTPAALCAFDLLLHDLLGLAAGLPLYRLLGGYRSRIQTSVTVGVAPVKESVEMAMARADQGFRILKVKGGLSPDEDVQRIRAIRTALPNLVLRLDADEGYTIQQALHVANALEGELEMLEQPTPADDLSALCEVTRQSPVPILADQSVKGPTSALDIASLRAADGMSVKLATCGGLRCARQVDTIARAARMATMVGCVNEPALLTAAGLSFALSSPNVQYGDLDGHLDLLNDPTIAGFSLSDGWLYASEVPGLGSGVEL